MLVRKFLFESKIGELVLAFLERTTGLAVVQADRLADQRSGIPQAATAKVKQCTS